MPRQRKRRSTPYDVEVIFTNLEDQKLPLDFTYEGTGYNLLPGQKHTLPVNVVEHLNSLSYPVYAWEKDERGQVKSQASGVKKRFQCTPTDYGDYGKKMEAWKTKDVGIGVSDFINLRVDAFKEFVVENKDRLTAATEPVRRRIEDKWKKLCPDEPCPVKI